MSEEATTTTTDSQEAYKPTETATTETATTEVTDEAKPYLGGGDTPPADKPADDTGDKTEAKEEKKEFTDDDFIKGIVGDEKILGNMKLDEGYIKAMAPAFKEAGISPEQANKLANAFAKAQMEDTRERLKERNAYFESMKQESMRKYNANDFAQINAGIDKWFKPNGVMNNVIRNSELGADPEFLALMHHLGAAVKTDGVAGASSGAGEGTGDANSYNGISKMW